MFRGRGEALDSCPLYAPPSDCYSDSPFKKHLPPGSSNFNKRCASVSSDVAPCPWGRNKQSPSLHPPRTRRPEGQAEGHARPAAGPPLDAKWGSRGLAHGRLCGWHGAKH